MNDKVILTCGSTQGEISVYYIDWDERDPDYARKCKKENDEHHQYHKKLFTPFNFFDKGPKAYNRGGKKWDDDKSKKV